MLNEIDLFYERQEEPNRSCMLALRDLILSIDDEITLAWKYRMPFFCYKGKMFCYLWNDKKTTEPYIGIVEGKRIKHPELKQGNRSRMKIFRVNPTEDLPIETIQWLINQALDLYKNGVVKVKK